MKNKAFVYWLAVLLWAGLIFYLSGRPRIASGLEEFESGKILDFLLRKCVHVFEFFTLSVLFYRALINTVSLKTSWAMVYTVLFSLIYAISDEFHQSFTPGREARVSDVLIDSIGIILFLYINKVLFLKKSK